MKVLVAYASTEGQTGKIAEKIAAQIRQMGHDVELSDAMRKRQSVHADDFDAFIIAGSVHQERHQREIEAFVAACQDQLAARPGMFISVSLAAAFEEKAADAEKYINDFQSLTGWTPGRSLAVAGAIKSDEYDYFQQQILEHIVMQGEQDHSSGEDREFTDWDALSGEIEAFISAAA